MAARILDDILNNFLSLDCVLEWLSNKNAENEENIFFNDYECNQVNFVSYFLVLLREQSSRDFQVYDAETPRKNSHPRRVKNSSPVVEDISVQSKTPQNVSLNMSHIDLESLQSFPTLSSSSSIMGSEKKNLESTPSDSLHDNSNRDTSEKKSRKIKLFSETLEGNVRGNNSFRKELEFIEDAEMKQISENKFAVSTPKQLRNSSLPIIDCFNSSGFQSETSPRPDSRQKWRNQSWDLSPEIASPSLKNRSFSGDSSQRSKDNKMNCRMSLGDFILSDISSDSKKDKKGKARRRINPVKVSSMSQISVNSTFSEKTDDSLDSSRSIHLDEKQISKSNSETKVEETSQKEEKKETTPVKTLNLSRESQAEPELVTCAKELRTLSQIYSFILNENYCQNVMIELCFVVSLLVIQDYNKKFSDLGLDCKVSGDKKYFGSIHNCVFFAVETLWLQRNVLLLLNLSALKMLSENDRIGKFNSELKEFLVNAYSKRQSSEEIKRHNGLMKAGMQGFVSFQYETDNRENFTSDASFSSFRKQRDLFYNILATWEANHLVRGWIFSIGLGSKIRSLLSLSSDPVNLLHLARLFRNQLIMSCCGESQAEEDINEEILQLLPSADPNRILRLRARLTSSPKRQGPCPLPDFTGHQEFYKDFILNASHSGFHEHLKNSLCDEILRLNEAELTGDMEDDDLCLDEQIRDRYLQCTNILRVLAKFLGFVQFLPYCGEKPHSDRILNIHCSVRNSTLPLFDVVSCLNSAMRKQKLTLTIPWLVSYLSMIDPYSAHLKFYQNVWRILILIYKHLSTFENAKNGFYLKLSLGWIFQLPSFPSDQFYEVVDEYLKTPPESLGLDVGGGDGKPGLDRRDFLEETALYAACPFLNEINAILSEDSGCAVRHIRPVTTQESSFSKSHASKQLELRLESSFLHNQSSSTGKTVEFATERVASIAIKHLVHSVIPRIKESAWAELESSTTSDPKEAKTEAEALSEKYYKELLSVCERESWEISRKRAEMAMKALLSNDLQGSVADTCGKIVTRQAAEKVQRWTLSHLTLAMVKKEFLSVVRKKFARKSAENPAAFDCSDACPRKGGPGKDSHCLPSNGRGVAQDEEAPPASRTLKTVRELVLKMHEEGAHAREVGEVIEEAIRTVRGRNDVIPAAEKTLLCFLVDLIVMLCVRSEGDVPLEIFRKFFEFLKSIHLENHPQNSLERIVCPRNVSLIRNDAKNQSKAWQNLASFLMCLLEEDFLTKEQIETQLLSLLRLNWDKEDGAEFSKFISIVLERYSKSNGCDKFSLLLEYMIDAINDDEPKSESVG